MTCFNPRSRGGSDALYRTARGTKICFNPRSRGGSDTVTGPGPAFRRLVSIHAPAGGATPGIGLFFRAYGVSIHAPAGGATTGWPHTTYKTK